MELEILANDIEEESDFEGDEAAFDLTEDGGDEDGDNDEDEDAEEEIDEDIDDVEDDDDDEDEFGRTRGSLVPSQYASRIQEEIAKLRAQGKSAVTVSNADSAIDDQEEYSMEEAATSSSNDDSDSNIIKPPKIKEKKRVRFSETIEIKRFEKNPPKKKPANSTGMISLTQRLSPLKMLLYQSHLQLSQRPKLQPAKLIMIPIQRDLLEFQNSNLKEWNLEPVQRGQTFSFPTMNLSLKHILPSNQTQLLATRF